MTNEKRHSRNENEFIVARIPMAATAALEPESGSDVTAPMIFNAWYVIALGTDVGRTLGRIKVLGEPLVYFRTENGQPVVLDDRCMHRRFSLSKGQLVGDTVQCGYHGFTYDRTGRCVWAPGLPVTEGQERKLRFGVRAYPCVERGPWLWVWMGEPEDADPKDIPLPALAYEAGSHICGYKMNPANYMLLIENLLDLSHLCFLHKATDMANVAVLPREVPAPPNSVAWSKVVERTESNLAAILTGGDPKQLVRQEDGVTQFGPALMYGYQRREALPGDEVPVKPALLEVAHALTPADYKNTHQFFVVVMSDPFAIDPAEALRIIQDVVFEQDVETLGAIQEHVDEDVRPGNVEISMGFDVFGIKMRKILRDMKARERSA